MIHNGGFVQGGIQYLEGYVCLGEVIRRGGIYSDITRAKGGPRVGLLAMS